MQIEGSTILVTGSNRGIGQALVDAALDRGAARVCASTRVAFEHSDQRVAPLRIDVTDAEQVAEAAARVEQLDILVNNAGIAHYDDLGDRAAFEAHLAVNLFGTYAVTQAFLPVLEQAGGALVNNVSMMALAPFPVTPAYALSKAAAFKPDSVAARVACAAPRQRPCGSDRPNRHRHDSRLRNSQGDTRIGRAGDP
jgi:NAD(P)-dependent dehydrogenase (short-subunit alcohol dehydrogenase family)